MGFIDEIKARAKADVKTIVLPETEDERTYKAAEAVLKEGTAKLILVGSKEEIEKNGAGYDLTGCLLYTSCGHQQKKDRSRTGKAGDQRG